MSPGQTIFAAGASGAIGTLVVQIAARRGIRVSGSASSGGWARGSGVRRRSSIRATGSSHGRSPGHVPRAGRLALDVGGTRSIDAMLRQSDKGDGGAAIVFPSEEAAAGYASQRLMDWQIVVYEETCQHDKRKNRAGTALWRRPMDNDEIAHDLAIAYINNRYGPDVKGDFVVTSSTDVERGAVDAVDGSGSVTTERLPDVDAPVMIKVGTGERYFRFGPEKKHWTPTDEFEVDPVLRRMISDYQAAYARLLHLLENG